MTDNTFLPSRFTRTSTGITLYSAAAKFDELRRNILLKERLILSQPKSIGLYREGSVSNSASATLTAYKLCKRCPWITANFDKVKGNGEGL